jgi:hypothetical protein
LKINEDDEKFKDRVNNFRDMISGGSPSVVELVSSIK